MEKQRVFTLIICLCCGLILCTEGAEFSQTPKAKRSGNKVEITFAVSKPTDAAVEIVGRDGKVIRNLGGAKLGGKNPPPLPFKPGLSQSLLWDMLDNRGKPAGNGGFKVRVRLGLKAEFDRFIGWKKSPPFWLCSVNGLAVTPDRNLYIILIDTSAPSAGRSENRIISLSKEGEYIKTIYPFPAAIDPKKMKDTDFYSTEKGRVTPRVYDRACPSYLPGMRAINRCTMAASSDGRLVFPSGWAVELYGFGPRSLLVMNTDGTIPGKRINGPVIEEGTWAGFLHTALSPDGKTAYVCGIGGNDRHAVKPRNVVYKVGLDADDKRQVIFGQPNKTLSGSQGLNDPRGIAVDSKGNVYVSDFSNNRIAVLDPNGKHLGDITIPGPTVCAVHPKTDAVYVITVQGKTYKLIRINSFKNPKARIELDLTKYGGVTSSKSQGYHPVMTLDPYGKTPLIYIGATSMYAGFRLLKVEDKGNSLKESPFGTSFKKQGGMGLPYPQGTDADGNFYFRHLARTVSHGKPVCASVVDARTGEMRPTMLRQIGTIGKDGYFYYGRYMGKEMQRKTLAGEKAPFSATGKRSEVYSNWRFYDRRSSFFAKPSGEVYALTGDTDKSKKPFRAGVSVIGPDGKIKKKNLVIGIQAPSSLRVDSLGNIYMADALKTDGKLYPSEIDAFAKKLRAAGTAKRGGHSEAVEDVYGEGYGAILKFGPDGGNIRRLGKGENAKPGEKLLSAYQGYGAKIKFAAQGLKGIYPRISQMCPPRYDYPYSACWCVHAVFDLDGHNRLFVPDALQFCVRILDANFNEIMTFGGYDQADDKGGKANLPGPEIPFEYPMFAHAGGDYVYVTDSASCARRIVRVKLTYTAEKTVSIK